MPRPSDLEHRALLMILNAGTEGILQCDLWRGLDASSREGSRIALKLEKRGFIKRERELYDGRWTYRLFAKRRPVTIDSILDVPCAACPDIMKCGMGSPVSPDICDKLDGWLLSLADEREAAGGS